MKALFHLAAEIQELCISNCWPFCFIGGIALQRWGEPRLTVDVDLSLFTGYGKEGPFIDAFLEKYLLPLSELKEIPHIISKLNDLRSSL